MSYCIFSNPWTFLFLQSYIKCQLNKYCERFSDIAGSLINCGPVLNWLQLDNRGRRILVTDGDSCPINTPAVAAAYSIQKYSAVAADEISFDVSNYRSIKIYMTVMIKNNFKQL